MELLIVLGLLGWLGYSFFSGNTRRGAETVRAHVFLGGVAAGATVEEANHAAAYDVASGPTAAIQSAIAHLNSVYGGKQVPMILDAYNKGMKPRLPFLYRAMIGANFIAKAQPSTIDAPNAASASTATRMDYDAYYDAFVKEVKRLDGNRIGTDVHWVELLDEGNFRKAFAEGMHPHALARLALRSGMPGPNNFAS